MPHSIRKQVVQTLIVPTKNGELKEDSKESFDNPFSNILELVETYFNIYKSKDVDALMRFVGINDPNNIPPQIDHVNMYQFIVDTFLQSSDPDKNDTWMLFDRNKLNNLLCDEFFDEYNSFLKRIKPQREYPFLEFYTFIRLEAFATTLLPEEFLVHVSSIWLAYEDIIEYLYEFGWFETISIVYKSYGYHWFLTYTTDDPIKYVFACYAIVASKISHYVDNLTLKNDLLNIYNELLIKFTTRGTLDKNKDIIEFIKDYIINFDEIDIKELPEMIKKIDLSESCDKEKHYDEGKNLLQSQIRDIQKNGNKQEDQTIDEIAYRIFSFIPQSDEMDRKVQKFKSIWSSLHERTRKDIKTSIRLFESREIEFALFPMLRSLEYELCRNFITPFKQSKLYRESLKSRCSNEYYKDFHKSLQSQRKSSISLGSFSMLHRVLLDKKAIESSDTIRAFYRFLGKSREAFVEICTTLDEYKLEPLNCKISDIRNAIAHGSEKITDRLDEKCFNNLRKLFYDPPMQILFKIIEYSKLIEIYGSTLNY